LTVLLHEIGHALGFDHDTFEPGSVLGRVMQETLPAGVRRTLESGSGGSHVVLADPLDADAGTTTSHSRRRMALAAGMPATTAVLPPPGARRGATAPTTEATPTRRPAAAHGPSVVGGAPVASASPRAGVAEPVPSLPRAVTLSFEHVSAAAMSPGACGATMPCGATLLGARAAFDRVGDGRGPGGGPTPDGAGQQFGLIEPRQNWVQ
jgi:hypothetical protein